MTADDLARFAYLALLGLAIGGWVVMQGRENLSRTAQNAAIWGLIFVGAIAAAGLWSDIRNDVAPRQEVLEDGAIRVPLGRDGHYHVVLDVNGTPVSFIVDTGASDLVLSRRDAAAAGIATADLNYIGSAMTANGQVRTAGVRLDSVSLGPETERYVRATVTEGDLDVSLLGMAYLSRFARIEIADGELILSR